MANDPTNLTSSGKMSIIVVGPAILLSVKLMFTQKLTAQSCPSLSCEAIECGHIGSFFFIFKCLTAHLDP